MGITPTVEAVSFDSIQHRIRRAIEARADGHLEEAEEHRTQAVADCCWLLTGHATPLRALPDWMENWPSTPSKKPWPVPGWWIVDSADRYNCLGKVLLRRQGRPPRRWYWLPAANTSSRSKMLGLLQEAASLAIGDPDQWAPPIGEQAQA